ncbi:hypothetical protein MANES_14G060550v8 [Manihot esculenta]|uniref:Uncharacterized protein n=1 Tax=Manihot esculenta TaxID=3983 RepID=A0ACB7GFT3_MANES|nr:hypothetical protein MANES_14G060550v8 [Manihot esculenta]
MLPSFNMDGRQHPKWQNEDGHRKMVSALPQFPPNFHFPFPTEPINPDVPTNPKQPKTRTKCLPTSSKLAAILDPTITENLIESAAVLLPSYHHGLRTVHFDINDDPNSLAYNDIIRAFTIKQFPPKP